MHKKVLCAFVLAVLMCASAWAGVNISADVFPDDNFREYVSTYLDSDGDGVLSDSEIAAVSSMDVSSRAISSLEGIEYFTSLVSLDCSDNALAALDVPSSVVSASISPQSVIAVMTISRDTYTFDLSSIMTSSDALSRVTVLSADTSSGSEVSITTGGGYSIFC